MTAGNPFQITEAWLKVNFPHLRDIQPIGVGGQKLVFSAIHPNDAEVVLKLFQPSNTQEDVGREILAVQRVQCANVPRILEQGTIPTPLGTCYWVREQRVRGATLRERLQAGPLAARECLRLGKQMLGALAKAELADIVHRDVKPDNIIVDLNGDYWLLDFGLARHLTLTSLTATAQRFGKVTWGYAPPEQCRNDKPAIDNRADLFALGVTLYESVTGTNPFRQGARDELEVLKRIESMPLPPLVVPIAEATSFRDLVAAMTQPRRDHRPTSVREALEWMEEVCVANGI